MCGTCPTSSTAQHPLLHRCTGTSAYLVACSLFPPFMCVGVLVHGICKFDAQSFCVVIICFKLPYVGLVRGIGEECVRNSVEKPRRKYLFGRSR